MASRNEYDKTIAETEAAYMKVSIFFTAWKSPGRVWRYSPFWLTSKMFLLPLLLPPDVMPHGTQSNNSFVQYSAPYKCITRILNSQIFYEFLVQGSKILITFWYWLKSKLDALSHLDSRHLQGWTVTLMKMGSQSSLMTIPNIYLCSGCRFLKVLKLFFMF